MAKVFIIGAYVWFCLVILTASAFADEQITATERVVAEVFDRKITLSDLNPNERQLQMYQRQTPRRTDEEILFDFRSSRLSALIWEPILAEFSKTYDVEPNDREIDDLLKAIGLTSAEAVERSRANAQLSTEQLEEGVRGVARHYVRSWKINKVLYKEYGGRVIFQQLNPFEPVDAYRKLLEAHRDKGDFTIYDKRLRDKFWSYYLEVHGFPIPEEELDFSRPWWSKIQRKLEEKPNNRDGDNK